MSDLEREFASLASRVLQLETQQIALKKYLADIEFRLDVMAEKFNTISSAKSGANFKNDLDALKADFAKIIDYLKNSFGGPQPLANGGDLGFLEGVKVEQEQILKQFNDRVERYLNQNIIEGEFTQESDKLPETIEEIKEEYQQQIVICEEFLKNYKEGKRNFKGINLAGVNLSGKNLTINQECNLSKANFLGANLSNVNLVNQNLTQANLTNCYLSKAHLQMIKLEGGILENADLYQANLCLAQLAYANFKRANLSEANLMQADLRGAKLEGANLEKANFTGANLDGAILKNAKLTCAIMPDGTKHE